MVSNPLDGVIDGAKNIVEWCIENWIIVGAVVLLVVMFAFRQVIISILMGT